MLPIFYFTYANPGKDLTNLEREIATHQKLLLPGFSQNEFTFFQNLDFKIANFDAGLDGVIDKFSIFHFSGHAGMGEIKLDDGSTYIEGIANRLKTILQENRMPGLILFFLNGCSTNSMVSMLSGAGVPIVIGTSGLVDDGKAANFSIDFYTALTGGKTIRESFKIAEDKLKTHDNTVTVHRGADFDKQPDENPVWGLFWNEKNAHLLDWKIPEPASPPQQNNGYAINNLFKESLYKTHFVAGLTRIVDLEKRKIKGENIEDDINSSLVLAYPGPIGFKLKQLLSIEIDNQNLDKARLLQHHLTNLYDVYQSLSELLFLIMLSQLWDNCLNETESNSSILDPRLPEGFERYKDNLDIIKDYFYSTRKERHYLDYIPKISAIRKIFDAEKINYFIDELTQLKISLEHDKTFKDCYDFFNDIRDILKTQRYINFGIVDLTKYCKLGEQHLSVFFEAVSFSTKYDFGILRNIELLFPRFAKRPSYSYKILKIPKTGNSKYTSLQPKLKGYTSVRSIVMLKSESFDNKNDIQEIKKIVNLSPFILDLNVTDITADKGYILVYSHFDEVTGNFLYEEALRPNSQKYITTENDIFDEVKKTFDMLTNVLFPQAINT